MATLILTAVGTAVGGPIGGAIGAIVGQQIDTRIFAPKARQGPRLGDLTVQTSSYGSAVPKLFGTLRVAGTVIWATDLQESRSSSGGGKGKPKTVNYSYSASFAVALSGRTIRDVRRIWADGKLLRGSAGDFKSDTGYRLYRGGEEQAIDPLIASAEGISQTPAYRGIAYAMFEDFQLADYGNRIPSLTFEVEADAGAVTIGRIAEILSDGTAVDGVTPAVAGYAASGDSVRGAVEALADIVPLSVRDDGASLVITAAASEPVAIAAAEADAVGGPGGGGRTEISRRAAGSVIGEVAVAYYDVARDYQTGLQRATRGEAGQRTERLALPAALSADTAKAIAQRRLGALWTGRTTGKLHLGWRQSGLRPGAHVRIEGQSGLWKIQRWTLEHMVVSLELLRVPGGQSIDTAEANAGRSVAHSDLLHGPTTLRLLDLPLSAEESADRPYLLVAAAGAEAGWRRAALMASFDDGVTWEEAGPTALPAVIGVASTTLGAGQSALIDGIGSVDVELLNDAMWLEGRTDDALVAGANLALLGEELIQFGSVEALGERRFRLSRLVRGRRGTEWACGDHLAGEDFTLIQADCLAVIELRTTAVGGEARVSASGLGDDTPAMTSRTIAGEAVRPPSPVSLTAVPAPGGDILIRWVRRSRSGWAWLSGSDTPLAEEREAYNLVLSGAGFERFMMLDEPEFVYTAAAQASDGPPGTLDVSVAQVGTWGTSRQTSIGYDPA